MPIGDVTLNPEVPRYAAAVVVDAEVVTLDAHRRAIHATLVRLRVQMTGVEHRAPPRFAGIDVVREEFRRRFPNELGQGHTVLASIGFVDDRHALMLKDMFEQRVLV